jgi:8-oxo-dGTP diphosphatase
MSPSTAASTGYEIAAGGLVWRSGVPAKLAVIHRAEHGDWTLPKGRMEPGENIAATALREAQEETGCQVRCEQFLGSYAYLKKNQPKVVLLWRMVDLGQPYASPAPATEVAEVVWLDVAAALARLSHPAERDFLKQFSA